MWTHEKVFSALVERGYRRKDQSLKSPYYVVIYPQEVNAAVLYDGTENDHLHINHSRVEEDIWRRIQPYVTHVGSDNKGPGKENQNFDHYHVNDWDAFAEALGL